MAASNQQLTDATSGCVVALVSPDRAWCDRVQLAIAQDPGADDIELRRLSESPELALPPVRACLWLVDEAWLGPVLARHAQLGELPIRLTLIVRFEKCASERIVQAIEAGARGCLTNDADAGEALRAIAAVRAGELWLSRKLFARILGHLQGAGGEARAEGAGAGPDSRLTERQRQIAACVAQGMSNKQIGRRLGISPTTVKTHLHNIFARVGVGGRTLLALRAADADPR